jgi:hypothetical protein
MKSSQARAVKKYREKQAANGIVSVTVRLSCKARLRLKALAKAYGSQQKALEALLGD